MTVLLTNAEPSWQNLWPPWLFTPRRRDLYDEATAWILITFMQFGRELLFYLSYLVVKISKWRSLALALDTRILYQVPNGRTSTPFTLHTGCWMMRRSTRKWKNLCEALMIQFLIELGLSRWGSSINPPQADGSWYSLAYPESDGEIHAPLPFR